MARVIAHWSGSLATHLQAHRQRMLVLHTAVAAFSHGIVGQSLNREAPCKLWGWTQAAPKTRQQLAGFDPLQFQDHTAARVGR